MDQIKIVLLSHFYNEEFLLPHWIKHHKNMFDDVVLVNYQSADASVDIIKATTDWTIRDSRNDVFDFRLVDIEMMDIEKEFSGYWKVILNTTEFLLFEGNLHEYIARQIKNKPETLGVLTSGAWLVDSIDNKESPINDDISIMLQRFNGKFETAGASRRRLIHRADCGLYTGGRHSSYLPNQFLNEDIFCVWFGWCPYHYIKKRKLQIKNRIPPEHFSRGWGVEHNVGNEEELDKIFYHHAIRAYDLRTNESYSKCLNYMRTIDR